MLTLSLVLAAAFTAQAPAKAVTAGDYVGRWNVKITDAQDTFVSGGIQIDKKDGALRAASSGAGGASRPSRASK